MRAALTDLLAKTKDSAEFAVKSAYISAFAGLAMIIGPILGGYVRTGISARGGNGDKAAFMLSCVLALGTSTLIVSTFEETLPSNERISLTRKSLNDMQPLSFMQLRTIPQLAKMLWAEGFQTMAEGRNLSPVNYLLLTTDFKWSMNAFARVLAGQGFSVMAGGIVVKKQLELMGMRLFTTVSNVTNFCTLCLWGLAGVIEEKLGIPTGVSMALSLLASIPGSRKRDGIEGSFMLTGINAGYGRGFLNGALMNWRAVFNIFSPTMLGYMYSAGKRNGRPYLPWLFAGLCNLAAEAVVQSLSNADLLLDKDGKPLAVEGEKTEEELDEKEDKESKSA